MMEEPSPGTPTYARPPEDRLDSWKEIAAYLKRDVTTVQRWEKREGMPVHRHLHDSIGSVYAWRTELDAWTKTRSLRGWNGGGAASEAAVETLVTEPELVETLQPEGGVPASPGWWRFVLPVAVVVALLAIGVYVWLQRTERFWRNPIADARFQTVTDFAGLEQAAAVSRDGHFVAFLSDRAGSMDVWITQVGSGEFHNLTHGTVPGLVNPSIRELGFSPDGSLVTYWFRRPGAPRGSDISVWGVPALGGEPRLYLEGVAEYDWTHEGSRLVYHTPGPGDPLFVSDGAVQPGSQPILTAPAGQHSHFQAWSPDGAYIYFVQGTLPDQLDIWRIRPEGGAAERITSQNGRVSHPVLLDGRTLMYLASDAEGSGPWIYSMDVERRVPHRLTSGLDRYTSLAASMDGRRLVATLATPKTTLWRMSIDDSLAATDSPSKVDAKVAAKVSGAIQIPLTTSTGFSPRLGPGYLLYASATGTDESLWKLADGVSSELWRGEGAQVIGGPVISPDGRSVAFSIRQHKQTMLYVMQVDGTNVRVVAGTLELQGSPAWSPDGKTILTAAEDHGVPHLYRVPMDGRAPARFVGEYSVDPEWTPDGRFVVYSGPDIGTTFSVKAVTAEGGAYTIPALTLTRGARHLALLRGGRGLVLMKGDIQHKDLWLVDLETGAERRLTNLPAEFDIHDFDISADGREVVLERVQENSNVVLLDLPRR